jgi:hypothetical protein
VNTLRKDFFLSGTFSAFPHYGQELDSNGWVCFAEREKDFGSRRTEARGQLGRCQGAPVVRVWVKCVAVEKQSG